MNIQEISNTIIRGEKCLVFPLKIAHSSAGWITDQLNHHVLDVRGWGYIQYADKNAEELQDGIAEWVVETLNKEWELLNHLNK